MPQDLRKNISTARNTTIELLFTDIDLAFTYLQTAKVSDSTETKTRNVGNALKAYWTVSAKMLRLEMPSDVKRDLQRELNRLAERLLELGQAV